MKVPTLKTALFAIVFTSLSLIFLLIPNKAFGFEDHFDGTELDSDKWQYYENAGEIEVLNSFVNLYSSGNTFPYIYTKENPFPETGDFIVKGKIQYASLTTRGSAVAIGNFNPPNSISDRYYDDHAREIVLFQISNDSFHHLRAIYIPCINANGCSEEISAFQLEENDTGLNSFQIIYSENRYKFIFNGNLVFTSAENLRRPTTLYLGNPTNQENPSFWSTMMIDSIEILSTYPTPSPNPIILLPGLGGSWSHEAMILDKEVDQEDWNPTPFINVYDDIIQTFKNAGYSTEGDEKNLFIFNYDWRKPIDQIAEDLNLFIQNNADSEEIDLVGHSLGGLVARAYIQNNSGNSVDQLITVGSPHKGSPKIYYSWEGGDLKNSVSQWERIPAGIMLHLNKPFSKTNKDAVRAIFPGFTNLLPTFNYLKEDDVEKDVLTMAEQNNWLNDLNNASGPNLTDKTTNIVGENIDTLRWIHVTDRNWLEELLDLWPDGKPTGITEISSGDKTVLEESAWINGADVFNLDGIDHRGLIKSLAGQQKIVEILGLSPTEIASSEETIYEPSLFFQIASPATMQIEGPNGFQNSSDDLIFVPNAQGNYTLTLVGTDEGVYNLYTGQIGYEKDVWQTYSGTIKNGENIVYDFSFDPQNPSETFLIDSFSLLNNSARTKLVLLKEYVNSNVPLISSKRIIISQINSNIRLIDKGQTEKTIKNLYKIRQYCDYLYLRNYLTENKSVYIKNKLEEIISDLEKLYIFENENNSYNQSSLNKEQSSAERYTNSLKAKLQSNKNKKGADSYLLSNEKLTKAKNSTNYTSHIYSIGSIYLSQEGLRLAR